VFCEDHLATVPEDLLDRLAWAREEGTKTDVEAAIRAAADYIEN